jgi:hypothetical protein
VGGRDRAEGLRVVGGGPDFVLCAIVGGGEVAIADRVGVADELDLTVVSRRREGLFTGRDGKTAEGVGGVDALGGDENADGVFALAQAVDFVRTGLGPYEGLDWLTVYDDVKDLFSLHHLEIDRGSFEGGAEPGSGPLVGEIPAPEAVGGRGGRREHASARRHGKGFQGGKGCYFVRLRRSCICAGAEERGTCELGEKLLELVAQSVRHPVQYTVRRVQIPVGRISFAGETRGLIPI